MDREPLGAHGAVSAMILPLVDSSLEMALSVWWEALVGSVAIVVGAALGWRLGAARDVLFVRAVSWWLDRIVGPLIVSGTWLRRTAIIGANNALVCGVVVLIGPLGHLAWLGVATLGLGLGTALRLMSVGPPPDEDEAEPTPMTQGGRLLESVGLVLNLLEVPAIMLSAGLGLAQGAVSSAADLATALHVFAVIAVPLLIVSAGGEALWMGRHPDLPGLWRR